MKSFRDTVNCAGITVLPISARDLATRYGLPAPISLVELFKAMVAAPRPFYIVGHNPNSIAQVNSVLDGGGNTIEPDVNVYRDNPDQLCISEEPLIGSGGDADSPPF